MGEMSDYYRDEELLAAFYRRPIMARTKKMKKTKRVTREPTGWVNEALAHKHRRKKRKYTRRAAVVTAVAQPPVKDYNTVGVRFLFGKDPGRIFTYRVKKRPRFDLVRGDLYVANTSSGYRVVVLVEIHDEPQDTLEGITYKYLEYAVMPL